MPNLPALHTSKPTDLLFFPGDSRAVTNRLTHYFQWVQETGRQWHDPDLAAYRDYLLQRVTPGSAASILSTIRARYDWLLKQNWFLLMLTEAASAEFSDRDPSIMANQKLLMISNAIEAINSRVKVTTVQDEADETFIRLSVAQASRLVQSVPTDTPDGIRDKFIVALLLATGVRAEELLWVQVADLRVRYGGRLSLSIPKGKGNKSRIIPYGEMESVLILGDQWMQVAGIKEGHVFRSILRQKDKTKPPAFRGRLTYNGLLHILSQYAVVIEGEMVSLNPHDYRRTYARIQYEAGTDPVAIQQNLGHQDFKTTLRYIGALDGGKRAGKAYIDFGVGV